MDNFDVLKKINSKEEDIKKNKNEKINNNFSHILFPKIKSGIKFLFHFLGQIFMFISRLFSYKNIVTVLAFITVWGISYLIYDAVRWNDTYSIVSHNGLTILLNKRTGMTWRNVFNNNKDKIPSNWSLMDSDDAHWGIPDGLRKYRDKDLEMQIYMMKIKQEAKEKDKENTSESNVHK